VGTILDTAFGYHLLQTGYTRGHALFANSPINHRIYMGEQAGEQIGLVACADELPLESDSVDTVAGTCLAERRAVVSRGRPGRAPRRTGA
jgi:hypothetical protein